MSEPAAADPYEMQKNLPTSPEALLARLKELGIESHTVDHKPVFTVEESRELRGQLPGGHVKNLFLRNKREEMWLVTVEESKRVDLKSLGERLTGATGGAAKLSFGSPDRLMTYLGVIPGAVTPFAVINDKGKAVRMVLDRDLLAFDTVHAHPLVNFKATALSPKDLLRFLEAEGHAPQVMEIPVNSPA
ncbi:MAG TPA: prolyl-tRNA synthetase associated domain-containing protein [Dongiaceae bacterium]|jgi:Ala-tRNA(Pro) deacylase|nr:prolyl-tRNA synthetase associated domain-containing protein [Dongiaceae bacterium]